MTESFLSLPANEAWVLIRRLERRVWFSGVDAAPSRGLPTFLLGVVGRLELPTLECPPMLERARAVLPEMPSSFRSASTVAWSSKSDQPS